MRYGLLALGIGLCIGLLGTWLAEAYDHATLAALSDDARLAIEIRCKGREGRSARQCRGMMKKLFLAGSLDPDRTLRVYCDRVKNARWGGSRPPPPPLCVERYGGWRSG